MRKDIIDILNSCKGSEYEGLYQMLRMAISLRQHITLRQSFEAHNDRIELQ